MYVQAGYVQVNYAGLNTVKQSPHFIMINKILHDSRWDVGQPIGLHVGLQAL